MGGTLALPGRTRLHIRRRSSPPHGLTVATRFHKIQKNVVRDIAPGRLSSGLVKREMNPAVYAASLFFVCHCRKARIGARRASGAFPGVLKANVIASEKQAENG